MSADDVQVIRDAYAAFARQDIPGVLAAFDEDISWTTPDSLPFGGAVRGHDAVVEFFGSLGRHFSEVSVAPQEYIDAGDVVVVIVRDRVTGPNGTAEAEAVHLWRMRGGKAVSFTEYADAAPVLQILGAGTAAAAS
jgi:ketosteroid isomerase-like protein